MPGKVKVRIVAGRNLPVMDRASDTCDAFVEIKLSNTTYKTEVFRHSLNPEWNSEWFRFEVDDEELQDEPLQIRVMDYDTYSANDAIGKVYIDLNPLLCKESGSLLSGWFPIYDTMHGIRGEINVMVRVHLFSDSNKYRESSCGVQFFYSSSIPWGFKAKAILGFVEELVVNDDPEYQWIDKIRTPRASNEARQTLFSKLSGEVQRKIGLKALELGGNAVIGYHQCFDLEGESGIVVRGIGTAVILTENVVSTSQTEALRESPVLEEQIASSAPGPSSPTEKICHSPAKGAISAAHRRSSDSDLSTTPKEFPFPGMGNCIATLNNFKRNLCFFGETQENFPLQSNDRSYCYHLSLGEHNGVDITPLSYIPGKKIEQYLGDLDFFFIRESSSIRESGGLNGFIQSFVAETLAIVRAHVSALGGNAMVGFHMTQCILLHNPHKNQGQCLVNVAGDAVFVQVPPAAQSVDTEEGKVAHFEVQDSYGP
ncbi:C2 domain-containing protein 5 [Argiope bruennichi]|uniref:C2 domain-containing protein 5 n=1 Tax=Argiope bruennichi TaxID=94029 RepID=A0A8T0F610_ARGBR|nr:C2 domain-containing protein 5 [Argiope bruennichi]